MKEIKINSKKYVFIGITQSVIRKNNFDEYINKYFQSDAFKKISLSLNTRYRRIKDSRISYRLINHWAKYNLITAERDTEKGWRKYSFMDLLWLNIMLRLRLFNISLDTMVKIKESLYSAFRPKETASQFPILDYHTIMAITKRVPVYLIIFDDGTAEFLTQSEYDISASNFHFADHIKISLNRILQMSFFKSKVDLEPIPESIHDLSHEETELLFMLRMGKYESIKVKLEDGKIELLEGVEMLKNDKRIIDILHENNYQNIEIKQKDGNVVLIKRTVQIKP